MAFHQTPFYPITPHHTPSALIGPRRQVSETMVEHHRTQQQRFARKDLVQVFSQAYRQALAIMHGSLLMMHTADCVCMPVLMRDGLLSPHG